MVTLGIDIRRSHARRSGHYCFLDGVGTACYGELRNLGETESLLREHKPAVVAIGAPITLRQEGKVVTRSAERLLRRLQHPLCRNPHFAPLPSPMIPALAMRGAALRRRLKQVASAAPVLEVHPASIWEFLDLSGGSGRYAAATRDSSILKPFGINPDSVAAATSPLLLDALLSALIARLFLEGKTLFFGDGSYGRICLPRPVKVDLVALDVDGTLTDTPSPWRRVHERLGLWSGTGDAIRQRWLDGEISYDRFCTLDVGLWNRAGSSLKQVYSILDDIPVRSQALELLPRLIRRGAAVVMISSGFHRVAERIARSAGIAGKAIIIANELKCTASGKLEVHVNVSGDRGSYRSKGRHLRRLFSRLGVSPVKALAVGDGPSDVDIFERCGQRLLITRAGDLLRVEAICSSSWLS